jgi:hypothetical protein
MALQALQCNIPSSSVRQLLERRSGTNLGYHQWYAVLQNTIVISHDKTGPKSAAERLIDNLRRPI